MSSESEIAYQSEIAHLRAISLIPELIELIRSILNFGLSEDISDSFARAKSNFRVWHLKKVHFYIYFLQKINENWNSFKQADSIRNGTKKVATKKIHKKAYNANLNKLHQCLNPDSELNCLMFINGQFKLESPREPKIRAQVDISTLETPQDGSVCLKLNHGPESCGITFSETYDEQIVRWTALLENARPEDLVIHPRSTHMEFHFGSKFAFSWGMSQQGLEIGIKIPVTRADPLTGKISGESSFAYTNEPRFYQIFFNGSFPGKRILNKLSSEHLLLPFERCTYEKFLTFQLAIRKKTRELIALAESKPELQASKYVFIECPRIQPRCDCISVIERQTSSTNPHVCGRCRMEICPHGCGRIHHGVSPCSASLDEASALLISQTSVRCPSCSHGVNKRDGCNHITCRCRAEFCYLCGMEFQRDEYGHYNVDAHYRDNGINPTARCRQFS